MLHLLDLAREERRHIAYRGRTENSMSVAIRTGQGRNAEVSRLGRRPAAGLAIRELEPAQRFVHRPGARHVFEWFRVFLKFREWILVLRKPIQRREVSRVERKSQHLGLSRQTVCYMEMSMKKSEQRQVNGDASVSWQANWARPRGRRLQISSRDTTGHL